MRRASVVVLLWFCVALPLGGRQSSPSVSVAQCEVDLEYFAAQAKRAVVQTISTPKHTNDLDRVSARDLQARSKEMLACVIADPDKTADYIQQNFGLQEIVEHRAYDFVTRHRLLGQFYAEDGKGLR